MQSPTPPNLQDYLHIVQQPMDLSTIRNNLESDVYDNPNEFCRDVRLIFTNSRSYNTNKRSKVGCGDVDDNDDDFFLL